MNYIEEFAKCAVDVKYFIKNYVYIQHPIKGTVKFELFEFQEKCLDEFEGHSRNIVLKSRQMGISTVNAAYALWLMLFNEDKTVLCIANKAKTAKNLIKKVRFMYKRLPEWLQTEIEDDNKTMLSFKNGSQVISEAATDDAGRSEAASLLLIDEIAFVRENLIVDIWASAQMTLATGGKAILFSTPNGQGNLFHRLWVGAETGTNNFNPIKLYWYLHPDRNQAWRDKQDTELGPDKASQECLDGDRTVIVRDKNTGIIKKIILSDLYEEIKNVKM